jgi:hypothetical protein
MRPNNHRKRTSGLDWRGSAWSGLIFRCCAVATPLTASPISETVVHGEHVENLAVGKDIPLKVLQWRPDPELLQRRRRR